MSSLDQHYEKLASELRSKLGSVIRGGFKEMKALWKGEKLPYERESTRIITERKKDGKSFLFHRAVLFPSSLLSTSSFFFSPTEYQPKLGPTAE